MLIFFQQLCLLLFLWLLKLVDGLMEIFSAISGITDVTYKGEKVNIIEFLAGDSTVNTIFWCIFILAIGLTCIFTIAALIKNMINSQRNVSTIVGKFFLALLGTMATKKLQNIKSTRFSGSCAFLLPYLVVCAPCGIFEFRSCILTYFSKNRT